MTMNTQQTRQTQQVERESIRGLLLLYDLLVFIVSGIVVFAWADDGFPRLAFSGILIHMLLYGGILFAMRFLLRIYLQVWRFGAVRAYGRLFAADIIVCGIYLVVLYIAERTPLPIRAVTYLQPISFAFINLGLTFLTRISYYYMYLIAQGDKGIGRVLKVILRRFAFVDFDSKDPAAVLHIELAPAEKSSEPINDLLRIVRQFAIRGEVTGITQINKGYINRTYRVDTLSETGHVHKYTLQRINNNVFPDVEALMDNFTLVTDHLHGRLLLPGHTEHGSVQRVRITKDGRSYYHDDTGYWRMMSYFDNVYSLDIPDNPQTFYYAGQAFGLFVREMSDVSVEKINVVIPNFHNTWSRYLDLEKAIGADPVGRVKDVQPEIEFVRAHRGLFNCITEKLESGEIPTRICHNDCNLNNILFDNETHLPVAIIDLDTVMPSSPLYDYGDSMRIGTNTATDDEKDLDKVSCDLSLYEQYARGYLETCGAMLTRTELELLPYASLVITSEDGIRFLMDHINGDTYYNIFYPGQNLDRARTQLKLLEDMEKKLPEIREILKKIYRELNLDADLAA